MSQLIYEELLNRNGLKFEHSPIGLTFKYQGGTFLIFHDENDAQFFQLIMPGIYDCKENERVTILESINELNSTKKVVKAVLNSNNSVWLITEILLDNTPDIGDFFFRLVDMLHGARMEFIHEIRNS